MRMTEMIPNSPIAVQKSVRSAKGRVLTSGDAGKILPLKYEWLHREDGVRSGKIRANIEMMETCDFTFDATINNQEPNCVNKGTNSFPSKTSTRAATSLKRAASCLCMMRSQDFVCEPKTQRTLSLPMPNLSRISERHLSQALHNLKQRRHTQTTP